jgi:hypothetical protein
MVELRLLGSSRMRGFLSEYRRRQGAGGGQELRSPVHDGRYGLPDTDVDMSRFEAATRG